MRVHTDSKENDITLSHCLFKDLIFTQLLCSHAPWLFILLYIDFLQDTKVTPFKDDCKGLPVS